MPGGEVNYVHEDEIWRQRLNNETEGAAVWNSNWGFLAGRDQQAPRGFSERVAKYSYGPSKWTVKSVRVPDNSEEGVAAAQSEQDARKMMSTLAWDTQPPGTCKPHAAKGMTLVADTTKGVPTREAALLMRSHKFQSLGDACLTDGVDPGVKYNAPVLTSHEYGWRCPTSSNTRPPLEIFGVAEHAKKQVVKKFNVRARAARSPRCEAARRSPCPPRRVVALLTPPCPSPLARSQ